MSPCSGKVSEICVKKARNARQKRLVIRRLKALCPMETIVTESDRVSDNANCINHGRLDRKNVTPSPDSNAIPISNLNTIDGPVKVVSEPPRPPPPSENSAESDPSSVGILVDGCNDSERGEALPCYNRVSYGSISLIGRRREMEDAVMVLPGFLSGEFGCFDFFAVYDGHGGSKVAQACRDRLHRLVVKEVEARKGSELAGSGSKLDWEKVMADSFSKMDDEVRDSVFQVESGSTSTKTVGSTAVVALVGAEQLIVANCGDSRAVLSRKGVAVPLSRDHKPDRPDEMERVESAGGRVINWNGYRVLGVLATSRSIGDQYLKPYVISEPEVTVSRRRDDDDEFLILATDGLWDVVSNDFACGVVRKCLNGQIKKTFLESKSRGSAADAAAVLAGLAMAKGSKDNISIVVVELKKS